MKQQTSNICRGIRVKSQTKLKGSSGIMTFTAFTQIHLTYRCRMQNFIIPFLNSLTNTIEQIYHAAMVL